VRAQERVIVMPVSKKEVLQYLEEGSFQNEIEQICKWIDAKLVKEYHGDKIFLDFNAMCDGVRIIEAIKKKKNIIRKMYKKGGWNISICRDIEYDDAYRITLF
jgi:hypothetical protein